MMLAGMPKEDGGVIVDDWWKNYLTIEALEDGMSVAFTERVSTLVLEYSLDGSEWITLEAGYNTPAINTGEKIAFRANGKDVTATSSYGIGRFATSHLCNLMGNAMSMLYGDDAASNTSMIAYGFATLFYKATNVVSVSEDFLPATELAKQCYMSMFQGCTSLVNATKLPALVAAESCYRNMYYGCRALKAAPDLPATTLATYCYAYMFTECVSMTALPKILPAPTLATYCYAYMFSYCQSATTAPELPATTLVSGCYNYTFRGCTKLNYIKAMFTTTPAMTYTNYWLYGCAATGTFVKNKNATWNITGDFGIPFNWTVQTA